MQEVFVGLVDYQPGVMLLAKLRYLDHELSGAHSSRGVS